jgi:hypothetical protein
MGFQVFLALAAFLDLSLAQSSCPSTITPRYGQPVVADGFTARVIAQGVTSPRGMVVDSAGNLLVVEGGRFSLGQKGIKALKLEYGADGCVRVGKTTTVVQESSVGSQKHLHHPLWIGRYRETNRSLSPNC